jgi:hypothetical protein
MRQQDEPARAEEPFFRTAVTAEQFETALRHAVRLNRHSMTALHAAVTDCVRTLRADGMQCEAALLTMKACVRHLVAKHPAGSSSEIIYSDLLMEQISGWAISDFYRSE